MLSISRPTNLNCPSLLKALLCLSTRPAAVYLETLQTGLVAKSKVIGCQGTLGLLATRSVRVLRGTRFARPKMPAGPEEVAQLWRRLQVSEVVALKVSHIDSERLLLRIEGKRRKARFAMLSPKLVELLCDWYRTTGVWLFPP